MCRRRTFLPSRRRLRQRSPCRSFSGYLPLRRLVSLRVLGVSMRQRLNTSNSMMDQSRLVRASTQATLRDFALYVSCGTSFHSCNQAFRLNNLLRYHVLRVCCLIQTGHPQPSCYSGSSVLGVSCLPSDAQARWHRGQSANPYLLHCGAAAALLCLY